MNPFSAPILRPVATTLLALGVLLLGIVAYLQMPIAALPSVRGELVVVNLSGRGDKDLATIVESQR